MWVDYYVFSVICGLESVQPKTPYALILRYWKIYMFINLYFRHSFPILATAACLYSQKQFQVGWHMWHSLALGLLCFLEVNVCSTMLYCILCAKAGRRGNSCPLFVELTWALHLRNSAALINLVWGHDYLSKLNHISKLVLGISIWYFGYSSLPVVTKAVSRRLKGVAPLASGASSSF